MITGTISSAERQDFLSKKFEAKKKSGNILSKQEKNSNVNRTPEQSMIERFREEDDSRGTALPPLAAAFSASLPVAFERIVFLRDKASFVRAAVAVERFRRAKGALPPSLDALVPEFISDIPRNARTGEPLLYEPGPIEIPEETLPLLRDPDEAAAESTAKFKNLFGDAKTLSVQQIVDAVNKECRAPAPETRALPAMTLPGFRLTLPDRLGREDRAEATDFLLATPEPPELFGTPIHPMLH